MMVSHCLEVVAICHDVSRVPRFPSWSCSGFGVYLLSGFCRGLFKVIGYAYFCLLRFDCCKLFICQNTTVSDCLEAVVIITSHDVSVRCLVFVRVLVGGVYCKSLRKHIFVFFVSVVVSYSFVKI